MLIAVTVSGLPASGVSASRKADVALARKALIVKSDFPKGWTTSPNGGSAGNNLGASQIATCLGLPPAVVKYNAPEADSPTFNFNSLGQSVDDSVDVFPNPTIAMQQFNIYGSPESAICVAKAANTPSVKAIFERGFGGGAKIGTIVVDALPRTVAGNESAALEFRLPFTYKGEHLLFVSLIVVIMSTSKSEGAQMTISYLAQSPIATTLIRHLESVTIERLG
jgi:hypothetical protein